MQISDLIKLLQLKLDNYWDAVVSVKQESKFENKQYSIETIFHWGEEWLIIFLRDR